MLVNVLIRSLLGLIFAVSGYYLSQTYLNHYNPKEYPFLVQTTIAFLSGLFGIFLIPVLGHYSRLWYTNFIKIVASELFNQIQTRMPRMPSRSARKKIENGKTHNLLVVDTSAIIDGRLLDIVNTGFLSGTLLVPNFVLTELQHISDSSNPLKRGRGRRGFEILDSLKKSNNIKTEVMQTNSIEGKDADDKLLKLARTYKAKIITCDFNLNKLASLSGIKILNVNELANAVKSVVLPGELMTVKLIQEGREKSQGVGYLPDGTMIVVEDGGGQIGKTIEVTVSRVIQTVAGRMIFATHKQA